MFCKQKNNRAKRGLNNKGFSLIEILIAVGILVLITVPLAMNMISSSQINSKAKQTAASSDLTNAIIEMMQTVDLSDVLTDMNGYTADEYGTPLSYTLSDNVLIKNGYEIGWRNEAYIDENGHYVPVLKQEEVIHDYLVTSSINTRVTGDVTRAYFTGRDVDHDGDGIIDEYAFVIAEVENDEVNLDIVATITPEQKNQIVNIVSMNQTEVKYVRQESGSDLDAAKTFKKANDMYVALGKAESKTLNWFLENMTRTITVTLAQDTFTESATIIVEAEYHIDDNCVREADKTITKTLGSFSTNSTSEFARGIYVYYYPLKDGSNGTRDFFVINNKNELATPFFLVAMSDGAALDTENLIGYKPKITVNELSDQIYDKVARTTVCSNIKDELWQKSVFPVGRDFNVKSLGNTSEQQTLYKMTIQIYRHRDESFDENKMFTPNTKDLLVETTGTFIDTSEKLDIDSDKTTGLTQTPGTALVRIITGLVYNGEVQEGVYGEGVKWSGTTKAINAGTYEAKATPDNGYAWPDGTKTTKTVKWSIARKPDATATSKNLVYAAKSQSGVEGFEVDWSGPTSGYNAQIYTAYATPKANHAWADTKTWETRAIKWSIVPKTVTITWGTGENVDRWKYDGNIHTGSYTIGGLLKDVTTNKVDTCNGVVKNITIKNVGSVTAEIIDLSNKNYTLPSSGTTHKLTVYSDQGSYVIPKTNSKLTYNGYVQNIVDDSYGVTFGGDYTAKDAGTYQFSATPKPGFTWLDNDGTETRYFNWQIDQLTAKLSWGSTLTWTYDGTAHSTTCVVENIVANDRVTVILNNNSIIDAGTKTVTATGLSNPNYKLPTSNLSRTLTVNRARLATVSTYNFTYDGFRHVGVVGQYITRSGTYETSEVKTNSDGTIGSYSVVVEPEANYAWADGTYDKVTKTWKIYPKSDAWYEVYDLSYTGYEIQGVYGYNTTKVSGEMSAINIGTHEVKLKPQTNHAWSDTNTCETRTVKWNIVVNEVLDPSLLDTTFVYNGQSQSPRLSNAYMTEAIVVSGETSAKDVGTYKIKLTLKNPSASKWSDGTTADKELVWTITPKEIGISFDTNTWTYNKKEHVGTATATGVCDGDTCTFFYDNNKHTDAGSYDFTITGVNNTNYKLPTTGLTGTMVINKKTIGINWGTVTWTYDGTEKVVTPTATGLETGDTCTLTPYNNKRTDAGSQTVKVTGLSNTNYKLPSDVTKTMTINRAKTAKAEAITGLIYNGSKQTGVTGEHVSWGGTTAETNAGDYEATATPDSNHAWENGEFGEITISWSIAKKKSAYVTAVDRTYNGNTQKGYSACEGVQSTFGGTYQAKDANESYSFTATPDSNHEWVGGGTGTKTFTWKINKAAGSCTAPTAKDLTYNGNDQYLITAGSTDYGTMYYSLTGADGSWKTDIPVGKNAGSYTVYYYSSGDANHNPTSKTASIPVTIKRRQNASASVNDGNPFTYTGETIVGVTGSGVTWVSGKREASEIGDYTVKVKPDSNHLWPGGGDEEKTLKWSISGLTIHIGDYVVIKEGHTLQGYKDEYDAMARLEYAKWYEFKPSDRYPGTGTYFYVQWICSWVLKEGTADPNSNNYPYPEPGTRNENVKQCTTAQYRDHAVCIGGNWVNIQDLLNNATIVHGELCQNGQ